MSSVRLRIIHAIDNSVPPEEIRSRAIFILGSEIRLCWFDGAKDNKELVDAFVKALLEVRPRVVSYKDARAYDLILRAADVVAAEAAPPDPLLGED